MSARSLGRLLGPVLVVAVFVGSAFTTSEPTNYEGVGYDWSAGYVGSTIGTGGITAPVSLQVAVGGNAV